MLPDGMQCFLGYLHCKVIVTNLEFKPVVVKMISEGLFHIEEILDEDKFNEDGELIVQQAIIILNLDDLQWDVVDEMMEILNKFQLVLKYGQHHQKCTYGNAGGLLYKLNNFLFNKDTDMANRFRYFLLKRLGTISYNQAMASFLVPRHKLLEFCPASLRQDVKNELYANIPTKTVKLSDIDAMGVESSTKEVNEVVDYLALDGFGVETLAFWESHKKKFPKLYEYAQKYLIMMASSSPSECLFSEAGRIQKTRPHMSTKLHENYILAKQLYKLQKNIERHGTGTQ